MRVFADNIITNYGIDRIANALKRYAPEDVEFVDRERDADFVIIYAYGQRRKVDKRIKWIGERGQKFAMVQLAVRSTANPNTIDWVPMWTKAKIVWSYYDLYRLCAEDNVGDKFKFYYAPLGVDSKIFYDRGVKRIYKVMVGDSRDESVTECIRAAKGEVSHLEIGVSDEHLALHYSQCWFVSGLRRKEGFEMPVLEGLLCGARPICYDRPHYRDWFGSLVRYVPEGHPEEVVLALQNIFVEPALPVTDKEKAVVKNRFNWETIVKGFWERI
jgi:hypothetical protein